jgi:hypothetical protein
MALMFKPEPMPVEVIRALVGALLAPLGETTELIGFCVRALRCSIYRQPAARLKQAAYQKTAASGPLGVLIDDNAGNTDAACQCRELAGRKFTHYLAGRRIDLLNQLVVRRWIDAKLIRLA